VPNQHFRLFEEDEVPSKTYIMPVVEATLDLITPLNGGVTPVVETPTAFFVYKGPDVPAVIVPDTELADAFGDQAFFINMTEVVDAPEPV
jgi:hypothetical protein